MEQSIGGIELKILSKKKCDEILKRIVANEIIAIECDGNDVEAQTKAIENRADIVFIVGGIKGMEKSSEHNMKYEKIRSGA